MSPKSTPYRAASTADSTLGRQIASSLERITLEKVTEAGFANAQANARFIAEGRGIMALQDTPLMEGDTALVIAAGPSVHRSDTARIIKESGFKGVIVATESAMAWCLRHRIVPDLVVTLDPHAGRIVRWFGDPQLTGEAVDRDDYFARQDMDPKFREDQLNFNRDLLQLINLHGRDIRIAVASSASQAVVNRIIESEMKAYWWNPMYDDHEAVGSLTKRIHALNGLPCLNAGGNVGSACWVLAHTVLEKKRVGLVGMDFGYYADTPYNRTQYYKEVLSLVGPDRLDDVFVRILNPYLNEMFYTDPAYLWYRDIFVEMIQHAECETVNCTGGGILFGPGIQWMALAQFLSSSNS